jgi:hypothetical protein
VLQIEDGTSIFREAEEGEFWRVEGEIIKGSHASAVLIPLANRLNFSSAICGPAQSLKSGLIRLAPGADFCPTRFRIVHSAQSGWRSGTRMKTGILIAAWAAFFPALLHATAGRTRYAAVTIERSLDFLPGKSLGEIFLETAAKPADDKSADLTAKF